MKAERATPAGATAEEPARWARVVPIVTGGLMALLVARLVARLLAARPDNPAFQVLYALTEWLVWPLRFLDAGQPRFGAVLELSTLATLAVAFLLGYGTWRLIVRSTGANNG